MAKMVMVYPTEPVGAARVPGEPSEPHEVTAEHAAELLAYLPPAFTTNKNGEPTAEQKAALAAQHEAAWGKHDQQAEEPSAAQEGV